MNVQKAFFVVRMNLVNQMVKHFFIMNNAVSSTGVNWWVLQVQLSPIDFGQKVIIGNSK